MSYLTDFQRVNRRMHNKSFTVDNAVYDTISNIVKTGSAGDPGTSRMSGHRHAYRFGRFTVLDRHYKITDITKMTVPRNAEPIWEG